MPMSILSINPRIVTIIRWMARVWSILIFATALLIIVVPDPNVVQPVPLTDWIELSFYWVSILGLLLAWHWKFFRAHGLDVTLGAMSTLVSGDDAAVFAPLRETF